MSPRLIPRLERQPWLRLEIRLSGRFEVTCDGELVTAFETNSARALLAYLAAAPGVAQPRPFAN